MKRIFSICTCAFLAFTTYAQDASFDLLNVTQTDSSLHSFQQEYGLKRRTLQTTSKWGKPADGMPLPTLSLAYYAQFAYPFAHQRYDQIYPCHGVEIGTSIWQLTTYTPGKKWFFHCGWNMALQAGVQPILCTHKCAWPEGMPHYDNHYLWEPLDQPVQTNTWQMGFVTRFPVCFTRQWGTDHRLTLGLEAEIRLHFIEGSQYLNAIQAACAHRPWSMDMEMGLNFYIQYQYKHFSTFARANLVGAGSFRQPKYLGQVELGIGYSF